MDSIHKDVLDREEEDERELYQAAISRLNDLRRHSHELTLPKVKSGQALTKQATSKLSKAGEETEDEDAPVKLIVAHLPKKENLEQRRLLVHHALETEEQDNKRLMIKIRERMERVGVQMPRVEVRFQNITADANVNVGSAGMPTFINFFRTAVVDVLTSLRLTPGGRQPLNILGGVSGVLKPGRFTLLLGPPSSGKTSLLKSLAGVVTNGQDGVRLKGDITYNGEPINKFQVRRTAAYVDEIDLHMAELTVRETFDFAARCFGAGEAPEYIAEMRRREKALGISPDPVVDTFLKATALEGQSHSVATDLMLRVLGLEVCAETQIGNEMIRGVSGGQKKRVTTGEMAVGPAKVLLMDAISTGLDSSTTYLIVSCLRNICHYMDQTIMISLLQPPPEVYNLFDDIMVLSEGHIIFHGPREEVTPFFNSLGFVIPERKEVADFLQEVTSRKDQGQYRADRSKRDEFMGVRAIAEAFNASPAGRARAADLAAPPAAPSRVVVENDSTDPNKRLFSTDPLIRKRYALPNVQLFKALVQRDALLMSRNGFLYIFQLFQTTLVAILAGTLFLRVNMAQDTINDGLVYLGLLFFCSMTAMCFALPVFFKQRAMQMFPAWAFTSPAAVLRLPFSIVDATIFTAIIYFPTGLAPSPGRFFIFWGFHILFSQAGVGMFRFISALGRTFEVANSYGNLAVILQMIVSGFVMTKSAIPDWWIWLYWSSPLTYAQQALFLNEFSDPRWDTPTEYQGQMIRLGDAILKSRGLWTDTSRIWIAALVLFGYWMLFHSLTALLLSIVPAPASTIPSFSQEFLDKRVANVSGSADTTEMDRKRSIELSSALTNAISNAASLGVPRPSAQFTLGEVGKAPSDANALPPAADLVQHGSTASKVGSGMVMPFTPAGVSFDKICYTVPMPAGAPGYDDAKSAGEVPTLQLLTNITGSFRPGVLTALMGVSGAGKTTLMDVLAGRKTIGNINGDIKVNGFPKDQSTFAAIAGYVEQTDIHMPRTTVREALQISGVLRLHNTTRETVELFVDEVMRLVELEPLRDSIVGIPGGFGLSVEQRKRLTIAVELVSNPSIVFMDEPTSGLDARAAAIVMRAVRNTVDTGRTVVCTIHQPSIDIFDAFDELLLLKRGGRTIFHGPIGSRASQLVAYFQGIPGVRHCAEGLNPATWMLEVTALGPEQKLGVDFADIYAESDLARRNDTLVEELSHPKEGAEPTKLDRQFAQTFSVQFKELMLRCLREYWRNPGYNAVRCVFCTVLALLLGSVYYETGSVSSRTNPTPSDVINIMGALFLCLIFMGYSNAAGVLPIVANARVVFYRERAANMYKVEAFALATALVEIPYITLQAVLYSIVTYFMIGFDATAARFFWYFFFQWLCLVFFTYFGMMTVSIFPMVALAQIVNILFLNVFFLFGGFFIAYPDIPVWWKWLYWLDPVSYTIQGVISSQMSMDQTVLSLPDGGTQTVKEFLEDYLNFKESFYPYCALIMVGFTAFFWTIMMTAQKLLNFNRR